MSEAPLDPPSILQAAARNLIEVLTDDLIESWPRAQRRSPQGVQLETVIKHARDDVFYALTGHFWDRRRRVREYFPP